jgi:hypothetical protein
MTDTIKVYRFQALKPLCCYPAEIKVPSKEKTAFVETMKTNLWAFFKNSERELC